MPQVMLSPKGRTMMGPVWVEVGRGVVTVEVGVVGADVVGAEVVTLVVGAAVLA